MLKNNNVQKIKELKDNHGFAGQMTGGSADIHHGEGKYMVIEKQKKVVIQMFPAIMNQAGRFHEITANRDEYVKRQDNHVKDQDTYLASIIKNNCLRNERNMERMDMLIQQQNELIKGSNEDRQCMRKLIEALNADKQEARRQTDRTFAMLEKFIPPKSNYAFHADQPSMANDYQ